MNSVNGGVLHQFSERHTAFLALTNLVFDNANKVFIIVQSGQKLPKVKLDFAPKLHERFHCRVIGRIEPFTTFRAAAAVKPTPFRAQNMNHRVSDGTISSHYGLGELLRRKLRDNVKELSVCPAIVI